MKQAPCKENIQQGVSRGNSTTLVFFEAVIIFLLLLVSFNLLAHQRLVGRDEGFYLYAAQLVMQGYLPYTDFFYPQMPYLPYIYGVWMQIFGYDWYTARSFAAVLTAASGLIVFQLGRIIVPRSWAYLALFLFASSNFVVPWFLTAQTYSLSVLLYLISLYLLVSNSNNKTGIIFFAGAAFAAAVGVRLFFLGLLPVLLLALYLSKKSRAEWKLNLLGFLGGAVVGGLPALYLAFYSFDHFWFNNMGYHVMRSDSDLAGELQRKLSILLALAGLREVNAYTAWQFPILLLGSLIASLGLLWTRKIINVPFVIALSGMLLFLISFLPHPCYLQYFATSAPFFILLGVYCLNSASAFVKKISSRVLVSSVCSLTLLFGFLFVYLYGVSDDYERYTRTGIGVMGIRNLQNAREWNLRTITEASQFINSNVEPENYIFSFWPGYFLGTRVQPLPGSENHFGVSIAERLSAEDRLKYRVISEKQIKSVIRNQKVSSVIARGQSYKAALEEGDFGLEKEWGTIQFFKRHPDLK